MKKVILISTIFVLFLLMISPCIPAVQHATIKDTIQQRFEERINHREILTHLLGEKPFIDFANIYLLICNLLITMFLGKPSLIRIAFTVITIYTIIYEFKTGEMVPRCDKFYAGMIGMPFVVFGAYLSSKANSKALSAIILLISSLIYNMIMLSTVTPSTT